MSRPFQYCVTKNGLHRSAAQAALLVATVSLAACSADVGRFDLGGGVSESRAATASLPVPSEPLRRNVGIPVASDPMPAYAQRSMSDSAPVSRDQPIRMSSLPEPSAAREPAGRPPSRTAAPIAAAPIAAAPVAAAPTRVAAAPSASAAGRQIPTAAAPVAAAAPLAGGGETIEVQQGDSLYAISRRHRVAVSELMSVNNLQNPNLRPGQKLTLPSGAKRAVGQRPAAAKDVAATPAAATPATPAPYKAVAQPKVAAAPSQPTAEWSGSYTVASGDSLFGIARKHKVKAADLQSANSITDPTKVRPGTVLKVPGEGTAAAAQPAAAAKSEVAAAPAAVPAAAPQPEAKSAPAGKGPRIINAQAAEKEKAAEKKVAALGAGGTQTDAVKTETSAKSETVAVAAPASPEPPKATSGAKFRWPVKGKVIAGFGSRPDNTHNDGINISVPQGTEVLAAENGVVAYAGSELKGYGNLILVRHDGNWVSAYAHNDSLLVKRGDKIKRGQPIAKAGATGTVDQPQVHFELRQGSKPVDPVPHMEKN